MRPPSIGTTFRQEQCGCTVEGIGNLKDPWRVKRCAQHDAGPQLLRENEKLKAALRELEGFFKRNVARAEKAWQAADKDPDRTADGDHTRMQAREILLKAEARLHDANRFFLVVRERVKEALSP